MEHICGFVLARSGDRAQRCAQPAMAGEPHCYWHGSRGRTHHERVNEAIRRGLVQRANSPPPRRLRADGRQGAREGHWA